MTALLATGLLAFGFALGIWAVDFLEEIGARKSYFRTAYYAMLAEREGERTP